MSQPAHLQEHLARGRDGSTQTWSDLSVGGQTEGRQMGQSGNISPGPVMHEMPGRCKQRAPALWS